MKSSKFLDAQKAYILRQGEEGVSVAEICRKADISQATYFNWKKTLYVKADTGRVDCVETEPLAWQIIGIMLNDLLPIASGTSPLIFHKICHLSKLATEMVYFRERRVMLAQMQSIHHLRLFMHLFRQM